MTCSKYVHHMKRIEVWDDLVGFARPQNATVILYCRLTFSGEHCLVAAGLNECSLISTISAARNAVRSPNANVVDAAG